MDANPPVVVQNDLAVVNTTSVAVQPTGGALFMPLHVGRKVKIYPIQEHELESLNDLDHNHTLWSSIGTTGIGLVAGFVWSIMEAPDGTKTGAGAICFTLLCTAISIVSFMVARRYKVRKKTRLEKILSECIYFSDEGPAKK